MTKRKATWVVGALALATMAVLAGCSAGGPSAETGRGPAWRASAELDHDSYDRESRGQGRRLADQDRPPLVEGSTSEQRASDGQPRFVNANELEDEGDIVEITGTLSERDGHWFVATGEDEFQIGFGRHDYLESTGIMLDKGDTVVVRGHLEEDAELSVVTCETKEGVYTFRTEEGIPLWSGRYRAAYESTEVPSQGRGSRGGGRGRNG